MENPLEKNESPKEVCSITIMFPVTSDAEALVIKDEIGKALADKPDARIDFRIMSAGRPRV